MEIAQFLYARMNSDPMNYYLRGFPFDPVTGDSIKNICSSRKEYQFRYKKDKYNTNTWNDYVASLPHDKKIKAQAWGDKFLSSDKDGLYKIMHENQFYENIMKEYGIGLYDLIEAFRQSIYDPIMSPPLAEDKIVYRGSSKFGHHLKLNEKFIDKAFVSTSTDMDVVNDYAGTNGCIFKINLKKGQHVYIDADSDDLLCEQQYILPPDTTFLVIKIDMMMLKGKNMKYLELNII